MLQTWITKLCQTKKPSLRVLHLSNAAPCLVPDLHFTHTASRQKDPSISFCTSSSPASPKDKEGAFKHLTQLQLHSSTLLGVFASSGDQCVSLRGPQLSRAFSSLTTDLAVKVCQAPQTPQKAAHNLPSHKRIGPEENQGLKEDSLASLGVCTSHTLTQETGKASSSPIQSQEAVQTTDSQAGPSLLSRDERREPTATKGPPQRVKAATSQPQNQVKNLPTKSGSFFRCSYFPVIV